MPLASFDDPVDSILAEKPLPIDNHSRYAWACVGVEFVERRSRFCTGLWRACCRKHRISIGPGLSRRPSDCVGLIHVQPFYPGGGKQRFVQGIALARLDGVEGSRGEFFPMEGR